MDKKRQKIEKVTKPYLRGSMIDKTLPGGALKFFAFTVLMIFAYVMIAVVMVWDSAILNILLNTAILLATWLIIWNSGMSSGADAVNQGEIMLQRREKGRPVEKWEAALCYHPLKGLIIALVGSIPLVACSVILACLAQRQMTPLGTLPTWVSALEGRQELAGALAVYHQEGHMTLEALMRLIVRMSTMPYVNMVGAENKDAMLTLERVSPLLNLIPAIVYGIGYAMGTQARAEVHTNIALGKKKAKKKQAKERRARRQQQQTHRGPEQLN